ncbi:excisionase [Helcococcus ovis]|uniref:Helix-turn-helix domain-containing protein n=1 Tax=Helcococcus ovis TaxID=72026 RepID=A0A4R9C3W9_9FIRM|nr:excisionase [Helcococcus ovis]TFF64377.1 helix-turn-helix domain-containing protein [Helcococcus ovis]TFF67110.1 helix-turn-helix domain-containing protein [Helcococcus ovis]
MDENIKISDKAFLTLKEASDYFNIGQDKIRKLTNEKECEFVLFNGSKRLIKKDNIEKYLNGQYSI